MWIRCWSLSLYSVLQVWPVRNFGISTKPIKDLSTKRLRAVVAVAGAAPVAAATVRQAALHPKTAVAALAAAAAPAAAVAHAAEAAAGAVEVSDEKSTQSRCRPRFS